ncbi:MULTISPECIES: AzlD domain-containing protein [unclassified Pannonibacter]|uniref:AzlD domain-containing protein n=1 Tax=unclassified Pannonibacter TaxID=2627228 RepID=UPI001647991B|nr:MULTISPECIES: AzlD domain-containing protein [unclassified Pannonibacter]
MMAADTAFMQGVTAWWPYVMIIFAGWLATDIWRWLGVLAAGNLREDSEILIFVRSIATALVAGVISKLILFPSGALAETSAWLRVAAAVCGFAAFHAARQTVFAGVLAAEAVLIGGWFLTGS